MHCLRSIQKLDFFQIIVDKFEKLRVYYGVYGGVNKGIDYGVNGWVMRFVK